MASIEDVSPLPSESKDDSKKSGHKISLPPAFKKLLERTSFGGRQSGRTLTALDKSEAHSASTEVSLAADRKAQQDRQTEPQGSHGMSRRELFKRALIGGAGLATVAAGLRLPSEGYIKATEKYLTDKDAPINFIFISHSIDPRAVYHDYVTHGGFTYTVWNEAALMDMGMSMRAAKERGETAYFSMVDGVNSTPYVSNTKDSLQNLNWTLVPHPPVADLEAAKKGEYPDKFYVIGADIMNNNFGLDGLSGLPPQYTSKEDALYANPQMSHQEAEQTYIKSQKIYAMVESLKKDLSSRYEEPDLGGMIVKALEIAPGAIAQKLAEGAISIELLRTALASTTEKNRRTILKLIPSVFALKLIEGLSQAGAPALVTGNLSSPEAQKISTVLGNITGWSIGDKPEMLYAKARTAIMVEKADGMMHHPSHILPYTIPEMAGTPCASSSATSARENCAHIRSFHYGTTLNAIPYHN